MLKKGDILAGLDIGTKKVCTVIAEVKSDNEIELIGVGNVPSKGIKKGVIIDMDATVNSIIDSIDEAEQMAQSEIYSVFTGVSGDHIRSFNSKGAYTITGEDYEITEDDVERAIESAKAVMPQPDRVFLDYLPYDFKVDGHSGISDPVGMSGVKLEAGVHIITASLTCVQNIEKCVGRAGFDVEKIILHSIASGYAVLTDEEKEMGVVLIDIGAGTTDVAVFINNKVQFSYVLPLGGDNITNDVAIVLKIPSLRAEEIKKKYGKAFSYDVNAKDMFPMPAIIGRDSSEMPVKKLASIIEMRVEEMLGIVKKQIEKAGLHHKIGAGIVITGGGAMLKDLTKLAGKIFSVPVRIGKPINVRGYNDIIKNPAYSTAVGLVKYGFFNKSKGLDKKIIRKRSFIKSLLIKLKNLYKGGSE